MKEAKYGYAAPYGKSWTISRLLAGTVLCAGLSVDLMPIPLWEKIFVTAIAAVMAGLIARSFLGDGIALGVGSDGVHVNTDPIFHLGANKLIPWSDVRRVILWRQPAWTALRPDGQGLLPAAYICFEGGPGGNKRAAPPRKFPRIFIPGHPEITPSGLIVPITRVKLDLARFTETASSHAPLIEIVSFTQPADPGVRAGSLS